MKKKLSEFDLFESTMTPVGLMTRVMGGWELNGAFIPASESFSFKELEVFDTKNTMDGDYADIMNGLLDDIHASQFTIKEPFKQSVVSMSVLRKLFRDVGFIKGLPF